MKKVILFGAAAAVLAATPAVAQQMRGMGAGITRAQVQDQVRTQFARVDVNRDGFVTQAEAQRVAGAMRQQRQALRTNRRGERMERRQERFARLDLNRDGVISRDEFFAQRSRQGGDRAERRGDRQERRAERRERRQEQRAQRGQRGQRMGMRFGERAFARMDANRDQRISLAEATAFRLQRFDRMDANRDGRITREERQAVRAERQGRRG